MKTCRTCQENLPLDAFYKHSGMLDGHLNICKSCTKARVKQHRADNDHVREYDRLRNKTPERKALMVKVTKKHRSDPLKRGAQLAILKALKNDEMAPASACTCEDCGKKQAEHLHHESYLEEHWLDVIPLCARCHSKRHSLSHSF